MLAERVDRQTGPLKWAIPAPRTLHPGYILYCATFADHTEPGLSGNTEDLLNDSQSALNAPISAATSAGSESNQSTDRALQPQSCHAWRPTLAPAVAKTKSPMPLLTQSSSSTSKFVKVAPGEGNKRPTEDMTFSCDRVPKERPTVCKNSPLIWRVLQATDALTSRSSCDCCSYHTR